MANAVHSRVTMVLAVATGFAAMLVACKDGDKQAALSKSEDQSIPNVPVPPENGPKLGALANATPVRERPSPKARVVGELHAGALVARADKPYGSEGCEPGWYPVRPRGFVCLSEGATLDLKHPTLQAMALRPKLDAPLPYTYARARKKTALFENDPKRQEPEQRVREVGELPRRSSVAVVGSWTAKDGAGTEHRLALLTDGRFVRAEDLEAVSPSTFKGVELEGIGSMPLAFVVKQGVRSWRVEDGQIDKLDRLQYHDVLRLTGKFRTFEPAKYWAVDDGRFVRHQDVTVIRQRHVFPDFATGDQKWIDVSIITGTAILYEGKRPVYTTLVSVGRDRTGDPKTTASTAQGTFEVVKKHVTALKVDPKSFSEDALVYDAPWVLELSSGQFIHGAPWHDRFGIEYSPGHVQLSVADAAYVWHWAEPALPDGWHSVAQTATGPKTLVVVRK